MCKTSVQEHICHELVAMEGWRIRCIAPPQLKILSAKVIYCRYKSYRQVQNAVGYYKILYYGWGFKVWIHNSLFKQVFNIRYRQCREDSFSSRCITLGCGENLHSKSLGILLREVANTYRLAVRQSLSHRVTAYFSQ